MNPVRVSNAVGKQPVILKILYLSYSADHYGKLFHRNIYTYHDLKLLLSKRHHGKKELSVDKAQIKDKKVQLSNLPRSNLVKI